ncbi:MAG: RNA polymerase sigma factor [Vicinamibacterales bacterium]
MDTQVVTPALAQVLVDNHRRFLSFLERRVPSREVAEDILQDAFVRGITRAPEIRDTESIVAWFYRVLRNAIADHYRRAGAEQRAYAQVLAESDDSITPSDTELFETVCACVRDLVGTLKPEYAAAITRVDLDGVAVKAFADEQGITANNAAVRLHRAHQALKRQVTETCGTCAEHGCYRCECRQGHATHSGCGNPGAELGHH